ncbi:hypothetical protein A2397_01505 [Candidatus Amesbacteria bacterium RIFOXYB1_FULL_44_23]|uniref:Glycosyltransferase RgtA/B/C/D-like domain-containing protein n=1 Tax=Candidatus Amesbacteria bacterium RIFOXYB1_FULL_44_23 TaxID=1797263 RepID=A0A1F4ZRX2_9BACT|nr:MAG: hypothetical protein A2397_01505 [Candidatus Amesbacteria bacterium RIFOXYB1_FULL_44_23]
MKFFKHPLFILILFFLLSRLINLTLLPVFSDEALYMEWGWREITIPGQAFHSLYDAKQPFLMWFFGLGQIIFPDPLFGSRLTSVFTGLLSLLGLWLISKKLFDQKVAILTSVLYIVIPNFIFYDRQALMESALTACSIWSLYFLIQLLQTSKFKYALYLGLVLGLGFFTKNTAVIFLISALAIIFGYSLREKKLFYSLSLSQIVILIVFFLVNLPLFFQPLYWQTLSSNSRWTFTLTELLRFPISQWFSNSVGNLELVIVHLTPPLFMLLLFGLWTLFKSKLVTHKLIVLWLLIPAVQYLLSLKFINFMAWRYQTPFLALAPLILALPLVRISNNFIKSLFILLPLSFSLILIFNPILFFQIQNRVTKHSYIEGYVTGSDTGYQVNNIVKFLKDQSRTSPIVVGIGVHSFNPESGIWDYFRKDPNVTVSYLDSRLFDPQVLNNIECLSSDKPFFFIAKLDDTVGLEKYFEKVTVITNPHNSDYSTVYTFKTNCSSPPILLNLSQPITH